MSRAVVPYRGGKKRVSKKESLSKRLSKLEALVEPEFKLLDTYQNAAVSSSGTFVLCNGMQRGDHSYQRDGNAIKCMSIRCRALAQLHSSATKTVVRRIVFLNKSPQGGSPSLGGLIENSTMPGWFAFKNPNCIGDIIILSDDTITLDTYEPIKYFPDYYKKLTLKTHFNDNTDTGTITDILEGAVYVLYVSSEATNTPDIDGMHRLRFLDG